MPTTMPAETRTVVDSVRWETYVALADDRCGPIPRMTYDQGLLELMSPRKEHEKIKSLIGRLVVAFAEEHEIDIESVASTTFRRQDLDRGFEADESFYIRHASEVRSKEEIDLAIDPPPDLVIEVEITASAIRKLDLFAAMQVPEVWRHDGQNMSVFCLSGDSYDETKTSAVLPGFPIAKAESLIAQRLERGEIELIKEFRNSLRKS